MPKYERQRAVKKELERIPRGSLPQNIFRSVFNDYRLHGLSFDESRALAEAGVRRDVDPSFVPRILPPLS